MPKTTSELKKQIKSEIAGKLRRHFAKTLETATPIQIYQACAMTVRDQMMGKWAHSQDAQTIAKSKKLYYLSFEFLMGRALGNNMINLKTDKIYAEIFEELGLNVSDIEELEPDAGLGNGGLGRLAACFLDSLATLKLPAFGCGIRYEYGLFKQKIIDGYQVEMPDSWLEDGNVWEIARPEEQVEVHYGGRVEPYMEGTSLKFRHVDYSTVIGIPYDTPICGYDSDVVNTLRLWSARSPKRLDMNAFSRGNYTQSIEEKELAEVISKVLYPEDNHYEGKLLRLKQQYFFVSATIQWIINKHKQNKLPLKSLPQYAQIHINDTHPTLAIPEMMRILLDNEGLSWDDAWNIVTKTFAYTNHTIMNEALERWNVQMFEQLLPRIYQIVLEIDRRSREKMAEFFGNDHGKIDYMAVVAHGEIRMANLCLTTCHSVNGVAALHTEIIKKDTFADYYRMIPYKFQNVTNGITQRRWLYKANPKLADLITNSIGDKWIADPETLEKLMPFADDKAFRDEFAKIKFENKEKLAKYILDNNGITVDPHSLFDVQIKRLHEYKRQLLKVFHIIYRYKKITEDPQTASMLPETFIFGAKASPGYHTAKLIIKLIHSVADVVNNDPRTRDILKVVFIENYGVSIAEKIVAASELSEQISTASKEASGTGNMKLMMNGSLTVGTMDGANVEIAEHVGSDNIFIFGLRADEVLGIYATGHSPSPKIYSENMVIKSVIDTLIDGTFSQDRPNLFQDLYGGLVFGEGFADPYLLLADFDSYLTINHEIAKQYANKDLWWRKAIINTAKSGFFSSDRTIEEYNRYIWKLK